jgi:hypothetical protein
MSIVEVKNVKLSQVTNATIQEKQASHSRTIIANTRQNGIVAKITFLWMFFLKALTSKNLHPARFELSKALFCLGSLFWCQTTRLGNSVY